MPMMLEWQINMGTGKFISALLFWLPGLWDTHKNVEEA